MILFLGLLPFYFNSVPAVKAQGNSWFVSPTGSGTDCTQANPCLPGDAMDKAVAGDTIYFKHGIYIYIASGRYLTINKAVSLIGGWDGSTSGEVIVDPSVYVVIIDGGNSGEFLEINDTSGSLITISGFTFQKGNADVSGGAIEILNGRVNLHGNNFLHNSAGSYGGAVNTNSTYEVHIIENIFDDNEATYGGGSINVGSSDISVLIEGNQFSGGTASEYGTAIHSDRCSVIINRNLFSNMLGDSIIDIYSTGPASIVSNNFIVNSEQKAVDLSGTNTSPHQVLNNTIVGGLFSIYSSSSSANILNNIIYGANTSIQISSGTVVGSNNLFYGNSNDPNQLTDPVSADPDFVNPTGDDYHISKDSPAMDAGATVALSEDFDGDARPIGDGYDIGADEVRSEYLGFLPLVLK